MTMQRNKQGGFTLIELAIVLVIIGLILGAILKGQDLIVGARGKKYINWVQQWKVMQLAHLDRKGRYAGDSVESRTTGTGATYRGDGVIGNGGTSEVAFNASTEIATGKGFIDIPDHVLVLGNTSFYMAMGNDIPGTSGAAGRGNVIVVTTADGAAQALTIDEVAYMEMLDTALDNVADAGSGRVRGITAFVKGGNTDSRIVSSATDVSTAGTAWGTGHSGMIYYFDRDPTAL